MEVFNTFEWGVATGVLLSLAVDFIFAYVRGFTREWRKDVQSKRKKDEN